jgi:hypothetical protein
MNKGQKIVLGLVVVGGGTALAVALSKKAEAEAPPPPPPGQGTIAVSWLPAELLPPYILIDGSVAGPFPFSVAPGAHTVSFGPIPPYTTPPDQVVQVVEGQTVQVVGTYILPAGADVVLNVFTFRDVQPYAPGSSHIADISLTNPTNRTINYWVFAYPSDPGEISEPITGTIGVGQLGPIPPGTWGTQFSITMPAADGVYPVWLRFYEYIAGAPLTYIKRVNTGQTATVGTAPPPPPSGWPIETQLASIYSYLTPGVGVWNEAGTLAYDPAAPYYPPSDLQELIPGQRYWISVTQACTLSYGGKSWSLVAGWNLITW